MTASSVMCSAVRIEPLWLLSNESSLIWNSSSAELTYGLQMEVWYVCYKTARPTEQEIDTVNSALSLLAPSQWQHIIISPNNKEGVMMLKRKSETREEEIDRKGR